MASTLVPWVSCLLLVGSLSGGLSEISNGCIQCLCEAVSGGPFCTYGEGCHDGVCGPYAITLPYWQDGGRPTVGLEDRQSNKAYENCALDKACAEATIKGYMNKFHQDCNTDGVESCEDYAAIHFHGGYGCNKPLHAEARNALFSCLQRQGSGSGVPVQPQQPPPQIPQEPFQPPQIPQEPFQPPPQIPQEPFQPPQIPQEPFQPPQPQIPQEPFQPPQPQIPQEPDTDSEGNFIVFPAERTPLPDIDIRFGGD